MSTTSKNSEIQSALEYHEATKHSEFSVRMGGHRLDWSNKPRAFKIYQSDLPSIPLPHEFPHPKMNALDAIASVEAGAGAENINAKTVAEVLFFCAGLTREMRMGDEVYYMRAASATGALFPIELYVVCGDLPGLDAGVYHFGPADFALRQLREGDYRGILSSAAGDNKDIISAPLTIVFTSLAWRNSWKYEARSYRHWFWDSGVIAANLLATGVSDGFVTRLIMGFVDVEVEKLLGLKERQEATIALAPVGVGLKDFPAENSVSKSIPPLQLETVSLSPKEDDYPQIWSMNEASSLSTNEEVKSWNKKLPEVLSNREPEESSDFGNRNELVRLDIQDECKDQSLPLSEAIFWRGSTRRFARKSISLAKLSQILYSSTRGVPLEILTQSGKMNETGSTLADIYLIANAVDGLASGSYFFDRAQKSLEHLKPGNFRNISSYLCLGQPLFGNASAVLFLMDDLQSVLKGFGNRGYRAAEFEAGIVAGKLYISSYALKLGASGSTFYDDAVTEFFSPHASRKSTMIAVGIGIPDYKARPGGILVGKLSRAQLLRDTAE
ncbi:MAG: SagB/ThcOx family dehydrogenase [Nitrososphaerales archaeon]